MEYVAALITIHSLKCNRSAFAMYSRVHLLLIVSTICSLKVAVADQRMLYELNIGTDQLMVDAEPALRACGQRILAHAMRCCHKSIRSGQSLDEDLRDYVYQQFDSTETELQKLRSVNHAAGMEILGAAVENDRVISRMAWYEPLVLDETIADVYAMIDLHQNTYMSLDRAEDSVDLLNRLGAQIIQKVRDYIWSTMRSTDYLRAVEAYNPDNYDDISAWQSKST